MTKAKKLAVLASASPLIVYAGTSVTTEKVHAASYRTHECNDCHTEVAFGQVDGFQPFCPSCGGDTAPGADVAPPPVQEELLTSISCPHCSTANVVEDRLLAALEGTLHCAACAKSMNYKHTAATVDQALETEPLDAEDVKNINGTDSTDDDPANVDADKVNELGSADTKDTTESASATAVKEVAGEDGTENDLAEDGKAIAKGVAKGAEAVGEALMEHKEEVEGMDVDLTDAVPEDGEVDVKTDESEEEARLLAFVDGVHVLTLEKAHAGENADVMLTRGFQAAMLREAEKHGFKALASFGFKPVKVRVNIKQIVERQVQAALADRTAEVTASLDSLKADWDQCTKLAASALTNGFYKSRSNPLADVLVASLTGMGFKPAKQVVTRALQTAAPDFIKATAELASELMGKSLQHRNELAETLQEMHPAINIDDGEADDYSDMENATADTVTARLSSGVRPVSKTREQVTASVSSAAELRALKFRQS